MLKMILAFRMYKVPCFFGIHAWLNWTEITTGNRFRRCMFCKKSQRYLPGYGSLNEPNGCWLNEQENKHA